MDTRLPALVLFTVALSIAGCGGSSKTASISAGSTSVATTTGTASTTPVSNSSGSGKSLSASRLVAEADPICKQLSSELDVTKNTTRTQQDIVRVASQRAELEQAALIELSKLIPPASMASGWQLILADRKAVIEGLNKLAEDAGANNKPAEQPLLASSANIVRRLAAIARREGFKYCGELG
jgi:hypothetical protein